MERGERQLPVEALKPVTEDVIRAFESLSKARVHVFDLIEALERRGFGRAPAMRAFDEAVMSNRLKWAPNFELHKPDR
jgi:hypothetical protein